MAKPIVCPTVTATDTHQYREQVERIAPFAKRIHIDLMDGVFAPTISPALTHIWWPEGITADIHLMYQQPTRYTESLIELHPAMVIVHAEASGDKVAMAQQLQRHGIKVGVALLASTEVEKARELIIQSEQLLIFSGHLGYHGGSTADIALLHKISLAKQYNPNIEIAWDGGINARNAQTLLDGGVHVLNVGGYIQQNSNPQAAYAKLVEITK